MIKLRQSDEFKAWFDRQRDRQASTKIKIRIDRFQLDNPGDVKSVEAPSQKCGSTTVPATAFISPDPALRRRQEQHATDITRATELAKKV